MMKRFRRHWTQVLEMDLQEKQRDRLKRLFSMNLERLPTEVDLEAATEALVTLQIVYDFEVLDLVNGRFGDLNTSASLNADDVFAMGKKAYDIGQLSRSIQWFEMAWNLAGQEDFKGRAQEKIQKHLEKVSIEHDKRILLGQVHPNLFPELLSNERPSTQRKKLVEQRKIKKFRSKDWSPSDDFNNYFQICQKKDPERVDPKLVCYTSDRNSAYHTLQPFHLEILHHNPPVIRFLNIVSEEEMEYLKNIVQDVQIRYEPLNSNMESSRTGVYGSNIDDDAVVKRLLRRVSAATLLNINSTLGHSDLFRVVNYISGAYNYPHPAFRYKDKQPNAFATKKNIVIGDRIAKVVLYLNPVPVGGRTAFTRLGFGLDPVPGSAVLFYNLLPNGEADQRSYHASCPVVKGTKWTGIIDIREAGQMSKAPCSLIRPAEFQPDSSAIERKLFQPQRDMLKEIEKKILEENLQITIDSILRESIQGSNSLNM